MIKHIELNKNDKKKSKSIVIIDESELIVEWWYSLVKHGDDILNDYIFAEGLKSLGKNEDAFNLMNPKATGELLYESFYDSEGEKITITVDTRNFYKNWIDNNLN